MAYLVKPLLKSPQLRKITASPLAVARRKTPTSQAQGQGGKKKVSLEGNGCGRRAFFFVGISSLALLEAQPASIDTFSLLSRHRGTALASEPTSPRPKTKNLSIEEIKDIIARDISEEQYFISGDLTDAIYRDDCKFKDPTNVTNGLQKYIDVVKVLFDPAHSQQKLLGIRINGPNSITADWLLGGYLQLPWNPRVVPFTGSTEYTLDGDGLVAIHEESWSISPITALLETLTPTFGSKQVL